MLTTKQLAQLRIARQAYRNELARIRNDYRDRVMTALNVESDIANSLTTDEWSPLNYAKPEQINDDKWLSDAIDGWRFAVELDEDAEDLWARRN